MKGFSILKILLILLIILLTGFIVSIATLKFSCPNNTYAYHGYAYGSTSPTQKGFISFCEKIGFSVSFWQGPGPSPN